MTIIEVTRRGHLRIVSPAHMAVRSQEAVKCTVALSARLQTPLCARLDRLNKISLDKIICIDSGIMHFTVGPALRTLIIEICLGCRG